MKWNDVTQKYDYDNEFANRVDQRVQASKGDGPSLDEAIKELQDARKAVTEAAAKVEEAKRPRLPADYRVTDTLRKLRTIANYNAEAGRKAVEMLRDMSAERLAAVKPHLEGLR